jgi:hypothetical protein
MSTRFANSEAGAGAAATFATGKAIVKARQARANLNMEILEAFDRRGPYQAEEPRQPEIFVNIARLTGENRERPPPMIRLRP